MKTQGRAPARCAGPAAAKGVSTHLAARRSLAASILCKPRRSPDRIDIDGSVDDIGKPVQMLVDISDLPRLNEAEMPFGQCDPSISQYRAENR